MATKDFDIHEKLKSLKLHEKKDINFLLLGETGIGKSTFINSIANYLSFENLEEALKEELMVVIPSQIHVMDHNDVDHTIKLTKENDDNETLKAGDSATQDAKTYVFPIGNDGATKLRFIDTPGIGDTRGPLQDNINCENILSFIGELNDIHAICFLFNSNSCRITVAFEYCFKEILSRLDKSAIRNIVFIFTKSGGANFTPGETFACLRKFVQNIKNTNNVDIPLSRKNMFNFENDGFRYLAATKHGIELDDSYKNMCSENWLKSTQELWKLISYIVGDDQNNPLTPHAIKNTISINEARRLIVNLSQPLADITQHIDDNIRLLQRQKEYLQSENLSLDQLKTKLYMPVINLKVTHLSQPVTVCANTTCTEIYIVESVKKWHYKQRCHEPCSLSNVPKEIVGAPEIRYCSRIDRSTNKCRVCHCDYSCHMHVYYLTETVNESVVDNNIQVNISNKQQAVFQVKKLIDVMEKKKTDYEDERRVIIQYTAQFAHFLQENAITPFNDSYENYITYLIKTEESSGDPENVKSLKRLLQEYREIKDSLDNAMKLQNTGNYLNVAQSQSVTPKMVLDNMSKLYSLPLTGKKIKEMLESQKTSRSREYDKNSEYYHGQYYTKKNKKDGTSFFKKYDLTNRFNAGNWGEISAYGGQINQYLNQYFKPNSSIEHDNSYSEPSSSEKDSGNWRDISGYGNQINQYLNQYFKPNSSIEHDNSYSQPPPSLEKDSGNVSLEHYQDSNNEFSTIPPHNSYSQPTLSEYDSGNFNPEHLSDLIKTSSKENIDSLPELQKSNSQETSKVNLLPNENSQHESEPNQDPLSDCTIL